MTLQTEAFDEETQRLTNNEETESGTTALLTNEDAARIAMTQQTSPRPDASKDSVPAVPGSAVQDGSPAKEPDEDMVLTFRYEPSVPQGTFKFSNTSVSVRRNQPTRYGIRDQVAMTFDVELPTGTFPLEQKYIASKSTKSLFNEIVTQMLGYSVGKTFDCRSLRGLAGTLEVVHNVGQEGDTFANVKRVWDCVRIGS